MAKRIHSPNCKCGHSELAHEKVGSWYDSKCILCECQAFKRSRRIRFWEKKGRHHVE